MIYKKPYLMFILFSVFIFSLEYLCSAATRLQPPVDPYTKDAAISSPWGPRNLGGSVEYHNGIDYPKGMYEPIQSVEAGVITTITVDPGGSIYMVVLGKTTAFGYMHMFDDDNPGAVDSTYLKCLACRIRTGFLHNGASSAPVDLVDLNSYFFLPPGTTIELGSTPKCNAMIFWEGTDGRNSPPSKILTSTSCAGKTFAGAVARATVSDREVIAAVGNSGKSTGPHLHLGADGFKTNPLIYVDHLASHYNATFQVTPGGESVSLNVDYTTGKDLDGVAFGIDPVNPSSNVTKILLFSYKGSPFSPKCGDFVFAAGGCTEVLLGPKTKDIQKSNGESLGIIPTGSGKATFVVPIAGGGTYLPAPGYPCDPKLTSCGSPVVIQNYPTYDILISPFNVCGFESPVPMVPYNFFYTPSYTLTGVSWVTLPTNYNVFPSTGALSFMLPSFTPGACPFIPAP